MRYIALLRGVNVGGNNIVPMPQLRRLFEERGHAQVVTYINSGNVVFDTDEAPADVQAWCQAAILERFSVRTPVCLVAGDVLARCLAQAPAWWNSDTDSRHNAIFVIPPLTAAEACEAVGQGKPDVEQVAAIEPVVLWSAPRATWSQTRWSQVVKKKSVYDHITIRNAATTLTLADLATRARPHTA
ncbi:MAG: DUF1697 domain-containing protein [Propionibacteriaceae bacterium]|nr:DUF1697 domain-containing protein [Propionibacteriaceae bacterium]